MSERRRKITWLKALALLALVAVIVAVVFLVKNLFINNTGSDSGQTSTNIETVEDKEKKKKKK
ncbi:hypothetical protein IJ076_03245, partial [Candidatus Saccharibacteria bacterium]|nr:hypothetical protein [Candidatus Saccharibacteria bacterium]